MQLLFNKIDFTFFKFHTISLLLTQALSVQPGYNYVFFSVTAAAKICFFIIKFVLELNLVPEEQILIFE